MTTRTVVARNRPVAEAQERVGQDRARDIPATGEARIEDRIIEPITEDRFKAKIDELAFMEEVVEITILPSADKHAEQLIPVRNGGHPNEVWIWRGKRTPVKRKYVEVLARARRTDYEISPEIDQRTGNVFQAAVPTTGLLYPFEVNRDPNPRGAAWLQRIYAEG